MNETTTGTCKTWNNNELDSINATSHENQSVGLSSFIGVNFDINNTINNNGSGYSDDVIETTKTTTTIPQQNYVESGLPEFLRETQQTKRKRAPDAPKQKRQRYTKEFKTNVLSAYLDTPGAKLHLVAKQFNIPEGTLRDWAGIKRINNIARAKLNTVTTGDDSVIACCNDQATTIKTGDDSVIAGCNDQATSKKKRKRQRYSNETKIQVILALETRPDSSLIDIAKEFGIAAGTIRGWREESDKIQKQATENRRAGAKANPSKDPLKRIWDAILRLFELNYRLPATHHKLEFNVAVVKKMGLAARNLLLEEYKVNSNLLSQTEYCSIERFKASETWARKWARDHQVLCCKKKEPNLIEKAQARHTEIQNIVAGYPNGTIYSMATSSLFYRILPHKSYIQNAYDNEGKQGRCVRACKGLKSKDRLTLYICSNETGEDKLPIACIGKYENPACFQVEHQRILPYLHQRNALSDAGTLQKWWRSHFLPHIRSNYQQDQKILLLIEFKGPYEAELLNDPTDQVRIKEIPESPGNDTNVIDPLGTRNKICPQFQPIDFELIDTIKRRYRYRLLQETIESFDECTLRRNVANNANFPHDARGLREGYLANLCDAMRLLKGIYKEVATTSIIRSWQRSKLRATNYLPPKMIGKPGHRAKSEKRQTTREKKLLVKNLADFFSENESRNFTLDKGANRLEEEIEKVRECFSFTDGKLSEDDKNDDIEKDKKDKIHKDLEDWISLEDSPALVKLGIDETIELMKLKYLVGLEEPFEGVASEADEREDPELDDQKIKINKAKDRELDLDRAMDLAVTIKATAVKLFNNGDILGDLGSRLDEASDSIFRLLREKKEVISLKKQAENIKAKKKNIVRLSSSGVLIDDIDTTIAGELLIATTNNATDLDGATTETIIVDDTFTVAV